MNKNKNKDKLEENNKINMYNRKYIDYITIENAYIIKKDMNKNNNENVMKYSEKSAIKTREIDNEQQEQHCMMCH